MSNNLTLSPNQVRIAQQAGGLTFKPLSRKMFRCNQFPEHREKLLLGRLQL